MKKFCAAVFLALCIAGIAFLVFLQRVEKPLPPVLLRADSLCNACPELAIRLLYSRAPSMEQADRRVRSRYALLTIKARDKAFIPHTSDTLIRKIVAYYDAHGSTRERVEAYYYLGSVYRDLHNSPQVVDSYLKALKIAQAALHPGYMEQMQERVKHLNQKKINVCHLLKLGFTWAK